MAGCMVMALLPVLVLVLVLAGPRVAAMFERGVGERAAEEKFGEAIASLEPAVEDPAAQYDIDKTMRAIRALDLALERDADLGAYLELIARQDYRDVAPGIVRARAQLLEHLKELYALGKAQEEHQQMWDEYRTSLTGLLAIADVSVNPATLLSINVDRDRARERLDRFDDFQEASQQRRQRIRGVQGTLVDALIDYSEVYYGLLEEWDRLVLERDRAYLAAYAGKWEEVMASAERALEINPTDREAPILMALALAESDSPEDWDAALALLGEYMQSNPERSAPALVLRGVVERKQGRISDAQLSFEQASAYYPRQAEFLADMADTYRMRAFLRQSPEGQRVVELYRNTMLGAGAFSPNLQLAKMNFDRGFTEQGAEKILDHFSRRRAQGQFDYLLSDLEFCYNALGQDFYSIFPEQYYLEFAYDTTRFGFGNAIELKIDNRSDRTLHNATLVLALHLTDMVRGDYETIAAERTVPVVQPGRTTSFGRMQVDVDFLGQRKGIRDIAQARAILITNEAVIWVDTGEARLVALQEELRRAERQGNDTGSIIDRLGGNDEIARILSSIEMDIGDGVGVMKADFQLPRELAMLEPEFRLRVAGRNISLSPSKNELEDGKIQLQFSKLGFNTSIRGEPIELLGLSRFGRFGLKFDPQPDGSYKVSPIIGERSSSQDLEVTGPPVEPEPAE